MIGSGTPTNLNRLAACPAGIERHTIDGRQQVNPPRRLAELDDAVAVKVCCGQLKRAEAEILQHRQQPPEVVGHGAHPEIDVPGVSWVAMRSQRVAANHQVLNAPGVEQFGKLFEVAVQHPVCPSG